MKETTELFTWKTAAKYDDDNGLYTDNDGFITVINYSYRLQGGAPVRNR